MSLEALERRLQILEDLEAIRQLKARYAEILDRFSQEKMEMLFTKDAVCDLGARGVFKGREAIREFFRNELPKLQPFSVHYFIQPELKIKGDEAFGQWYMWLPATDGDGTAVWVAGIEYDKYEKVNSEWLMAELKLHRTFRTPYEEGWHKKKFR